MKLTKELYQLYLNATAEKIEVAVLNRVYVQGVTLSRYLSEPTELAYEMAEMVLSQAGIEVE